LQDEVKKLQDHFISLNFYRVLGNAYWDSRMLGEAARSYQRATEIAELMLYGLKTGPERMEWTRAAQESYRGWIRVLLEQNQPEKALGIWEWYQSRPSAQALYSGSLRLAARPFAFKEAKTRLPPSSGIRLVYAAFPDGLQIWIRRDREIRSVWVPGTLGDLNQRVHDFAALCSTPYSTLESIHRQGAALYKTFVGPIASQLPPSGVVAVELDNVALGSVFLEAFRSPEEAYLAEKYSIVYSPGMWMERKLRAPAPITGREAFLLVDAAHDLPGKDAERKSITSYFSATRTIFSKADLIHFLPHSTVLHFIGHGKLNGNGTDLIFMNGETARAGDLRPSLLSGVRLAVLEACSTEVGKKHGLLDPASLVHSFLAGNASSVIASRWEVDSSATSWLMRSFYASLRTNKSVALALANARKEALTTQPHPYFWAGFSLTGRTE